MGLFGKGGNAIADYLKEAERFLREAEKYTKPGKTQNIRAASAAYQIASTSLQIVGGEIKTPKDHGKYETIRTTAARVARSIINSATASTTKHLESAKKSIDAGDSIAGNQASASTDVDEYLQQWREARPEAAAEEDGRKQRYEEMMAELRKSLKPSQKVYGNIGYSNANQSILLAEKALKAAGLVAGISRIHEFKQDIKAARDSIKKVRRELESREE